MVTRGSTELDFGTSDKHENLSFLEDLTQFDIRTSTEFAILGNTSSTTTATSLLNLTTGTDDDDTFIPWDNPHNIITMDTFRKIETIVECGIQPILFLIGAPVNILNLIVFARQGLRDRMNFCLFSLALVDLLYISVVFAQSGPYCLMQGFKPELEDFVKWHARLHLLNFMFAFMYSSGCITAFIAVERCLCVLYPMKATTLVSTRAMVLLVVGTVTLINVMCSVYALRHNLVWFLDSKTNEMKLLRDTSDFYADHKVLVDAIDFVILPAMTLINYFIVSVATAITVMNLKRAMAWRSSTSGTTADKRQMALLKMLVTVSCVYITCTAPKVALTFVRFLVPDFWTVGRYSNIFLATYQMDETIMMLNSSVNFFVYISQSSRFHQELSALCRRSVRSSLGQSKVTSVESTVNTTHM